MSRYQFSLGGLLACISALCIAGAAWTNGLALARESKSGVPMFIGLMMAWLMVGAAIGFLSGKRVPQVLAACVLAILGATAGFALLVVLSFLF